MRAQPPGGFVKQVHKRKTNAALFNEQARFGLARCPFIPELVVHVPTRRFLVPFASLPHRFFLFQFLSCA